MKHIFIIALLLLAAYCFGQSNVETYSGSDTVGFRNGLNDSARYNRPFGMCIDNHTNLYIADQGNNCIRKINTISGQVTTVAGTGGVGWKDGPADSAQFNGPADLCVDDSGNVYVSDFNNQRIRKISFSGTVTTIAGDGTAGYIDSTGQSAEFDYPRGICRDRSGNLYVADSWNHRIRKITSAGVVSTFAGGGTSMGVGSVGDLLDANDTSARFYTPSGLAIDSAANIYVADAYNHRIRKITPSGVVTTVAGSGATGNGNGGFADGDTSTALLNTPTEVYSLANMLYISDTYNNRIRELDMNTDSVTTFAGNGTAALVNGSGSLSSFNFPRGIVADSSSGFVLVVDCNNNVIRLIGPNVNTGLNQTAVSTEISIYPNPSNGLFTLSGYPQGSGVITIIAATGRKFDTRLMNNTIDLSPYPNGEYFLQLGNNVLKKVVLSGNSH